MAGKRELRIESDCSTLLQCSSIYSICWLLNGCPPSQTQTFSTGLMLEMQCQRGHLDPVWAQRSVFFLHGDHLWWCSVPDSPVYLGGTSLHLSEHLSLCMQVFVCVSCPPFFFQISLPPFVFFFLPVPNDRGGSKQPISASVSRRRRDDSLDRW